MPDKESEFPYSPWRGWRPGSGKKYNPNDPHFNPMHPPEGYPKEALEREWGESFDDDTPIPPPERTPTGEIIFPWQKEKQNEK